MEIGGMSTMQEPCNSTVSANFELPMDLTFDILLRLPVKTLIRFKSACKTWRKIIENPNFIKKHETKSNQNPGSDPTLSSVLFIGSDLETGFHNIWLQSRGKTHNPNPNPNLIFQYYPDIVAIFNGLVCATFRDPEAIICNPTTGGVRKTPRFSLPKIGSRGVFFGFGFQDNEYKLFRIVHSTSESNGSVVRAEVYSMRTDIWTEINMKTIKNNSRPCIVCNESFDLMPVAINEVFYWKAYKNGLPCVVSFDIDGYVFGMIDFPNSVKLIMAKIIHWKLVDMKGELALTTCWYNRIELWVLKLNKMERSWTMKLRVNYRTSSIGKSIKVLGCERNGNLVMHHNSTDSERKLFSFDVESRNIMYLPFPELKQNQDVYFYTESLLLV